MRTPLDFMICVICHRNIELVAFPLILANGGIKGHIYVCPYCFQEFQKKVIKIGYPIKSAFVIKFEDNTFLNAVDKGSKNMLKAYDWTHAWQFNSKIEAEDIINYYKLKAIPVMYTLIESIE